MFKKKTMKAALATSCALGMMVTGVSAANSPANGETPVSYDNRTVIPDQNGQYGIIIPTSITFTDTSAPTTGNATVEITGINGNLLTDWSELKVEVGVTSKNGYKLHLNGTDATKYAEYQLQYEGETGALSGTAEKKLVNTLGIGGTATTNKQKINGDATLTNKAKATVKGQYQDTITYTFAEKANQK